MRKGSASRRWIAMVAVVASLLSIAGHTDVPQRPILLAENIESAPVADTGDSPLRRYLQGNPRFGWEPGQMGKPTEFWNQRIDEWPVDDASAAITTYLSHVSRENPDNPASEFFGQFDMGKKANGEAYSHNVLEADGDTPMYAFRPRQARYGFSVDDFWAPHCDRIRMPVPVGGRLQNEHDYACTTDGDCHLYVVNMETGRLYEQWRAFNPGPDEDSYSGGCANYWDLSRKQPDDLRGLSCSSANAAGIPYIPLLVTPGEIKAGEIRHALAFTMPNAWVQRDLYVRPATHNPIRTSWGPAAAAPGEPMLYGSRFRLRADFEIQRDWPPALRVILQALKDYGMIHIDGGPRMIITSNDGLSEHSWNDQDIRLNPFDLTGKAGLSWSDMELVSDTSRVVSMNDVQCRRTPVNEF